MNAVDSSLDELIAAARVASGEAIDADKAVAAASAALARADERSWRMHNEAQLAWDKVYAAASRQGV